MVNDYAYADEETIITDRPDFVESSDVVGNGKMQIEVGLNVERNNDAGVKEQTSTTPTLIRAGLSDRWELRMETDGLVRQRTSINGNDETVNGYSDIALGVKWHFTDANTSSHAPSTAWLFHIDMDTGSSAFRGVGLRPSLRFVAEWDLPDDTGIGIMPGIVYDKNDQHRFISGIMAVTYGKQWTPNLHSFIEIAGQQLAKNSDGGNFVTADTGLSYLLSKTIQVDASIQRGLTNDTPDWSGGVGFSMKF